MRYNEIAPARGSRKSSKRVGRGAGSGRGHESGRGRKGQKARSGYAKMMRPGFEGGQLPLIKRMPSKPGFTNIFRKEYAIVNVASLGKFPTGDVIDAQRLAEAGLIDNASTKLKVLGDGELKVSLTVRAAKFSKSARQKIEAAGGKAEEAHAAK